MPRAQARYWDDCREPAKPSSIQPRSSKSPAAGTVRSRRDSRHHPASALCTLAPRLLCAHGGPLPGGGRSR